MNAADPASHSDAGDVFLTVTGTSAEAGDDGEVGRGNRTCGLITPYRSITLEAAAGKNPVSHVGKLYNLVASRIAAAITAEIPDVPDAACVLVSQIGRPVATRRWWMSVWPSRTEERRRRQGARGRHCTLGARTPGRAARCTDRGARPCVLTRGVLEQWPVDLAL